MLETVLNYFNLAPDYTQEESSRAVIIPAPYASEGNLCARAPEAILEASQRVEPFDEELWVEPFNIGIHTAETVKIPGFDAKTEKPFQYLADIVKHQIYSEKFPLILGGENLVSVGGVAGAIDKYPDLSVLRLDSAPNCDDAIARDPEANPFTHGAVSYQLYSLLPTPRFAQVGIRNITTAEAAWMENERPAMEIFWARHQTSWNLNELMSSLSNNVYLSIDVSVLDSALMPASSFADPGGISWLALIELIKHVCVRKHVVAADIVGLEPIANFNAPNLLVAKLIYKLIGYRFALDLGVTRKYL